MLWQPKSNASKVGRKCRDSANPTPLRLEEDALVMAKFLYTVPIHTVWRSETDRFVVRNGPFCSLKRTVSQSKTACIRKPLAINVLQQRSFRRKRLNYFDSEDGAIATIETIDSIAYIDRYSLYSFYSRYRFYRPLYPIDGGGAYSCEPMSSMRFSKISFKPYCGCQPSLRSLADDRRSFVGGA